MIPLSYTDRTPTYLCALGAFLVLGLGYAVSPTMPQSAGWENGPLENLQVALLLAAGIAALRYGMWSGPQHAQQHAFWTAIAPLWFMLVARELSWGAVFCTPIAFDGLIGPKFSSTQQLWYRPAVIPVVCVLLLWCSWRFGRARSLQLFTALRHARALPLVELGLFSVCMAASAVAEGHARPNSADFFVHWKDRAAAQNFEELAELCAFAALVCAQSRVMRYWRNTSPGARVSGAA